MPALITSIHNARVRHAVRLRERRGRNQQRRFLIDGTRELQRAWQAGIELEEVFYCPSLCTSAAAQQLLANVRSTRATLFEVTPAVFDKLAFGQRREGMVAVASARPLSLGDLSMGAVPLIVVLEGVEKPGNLGAVLRTADAAGVDAVVLADGVADLYNPNTVRASLGTVFTLPIAAERSATVLGWLRQRSIAVFAARVEGSLDYCDAEFRQPAAIVLGSESAGLSDVWSAKEIVALRIPMLGAVDSLNLSTAAAVMLFEARRQRNTT